MAADVSAKTNMKVHAALLAVQFAFGSFHVVAKDLLSALHPFALAGLRVAISTPILFLIAWRTEHYVPSKKDFAYLAVAGTLGVFINQLLFILGLSHTTATNAGILMPAIPVFTAAAGALLGIELLGLRKSAGVAAAVIGALVMLDVTQFSFSGGMALGNVLIICNCIAYSFYLLIQKPALRRIPPWTFSAWSFAFGAIGIEAVCAPKALGALHVGLSPLVWAELLYVVLFPTVLAYAINTWSIKRSSPALAAAYTTMQTVVTAALAVPFLGERFSLREVAGFVLIVIGLILVSRSGNRNEETK